MGLLRAAKHPWVLGLVFLCVSTWLLVDFYFFMRHYRSYQVQALLGVDQIKAAPSSNEVIVVLTGDGGRISQALALLRERNSGLLIISGTAKGIPLIDVVNNQGGATVNIHEIWNSIILESDSSSTLENAEQSFAILKDRNPSRIILVTSDYHMHRALKIFHKTFPRLDIVDYVVGSVQEQTSWSRLVWKVWIEYWKNFLYRYYFSYSWHPAPK